ncbi:type II secretion system secretin GspD [Leptospira mayottensis]|uniref:Type II secretion system protein D n=2 Tax=Leptospira mayottensis TaxID=1137606 RepID=A0AA87SYA7_9LEPT|nr:type II secretion system secretin GspD [Leptospira mayottensis]AXR61511.1 type II secretion system protein GspD [Leptospira mayottensis]AXR65225.1 type II secretion system protein GspD [Leptospira mayottensis]AXR69078.1 type II secretion system protein GspD [Leptospira mayottensis]AZQ02049.1 type II secretion system protein GspD [Leptospira mayottensis 200901116]EKS01655.1 putative type II secretion system protein D [Leptospira mayottensis 200901122]
MYGTISQFSIFRIFSILILLFLVWDKPVFPQSKKKSSVKTRSAAAPEEPAEKSFYANWRDTELNDFLKGMSAILKKNILLDESLKGKKITIISQKEIPIKNAFIFMKSVLESLGFGVVEEPDLISIVKIKDALARSPVVRVGKELIPETEVGDYRTITQIIPIENTKPEELEPILKRLTSPNTDVIVYRNTNTIVLSGSAADINKLLVLINELDLKLEEASPGAIASAGDVHIYTLEHSEAEKIAATLVKLDNPVVQSEELSPEKKIPGQIPMKVDKIKAVGHKESNSVIVTATNAEWAEIRKIIKVLDSARKQVLLEVLIVELTSSDLNDFGIDWRYKGEAFGQFNSGLSKEANIINSNGQINPNVNTLSGFSLGFLKAGSEQIIGILSANQGNENFNVLSAPQVLTVDNQEAEISVGQDVPVRTQSRNAGTGGTNAVTVDNYEYRPTGIKLKFTPHVNKNNKITLELFQEIKNIAEIALAGGNPTFNRREIKTSISIENTQSIVIGGLISNDKQKRIIKIPLLGDIPYLGHLFKRTTEKIKKTNLMVFITPHILDSRENADKMTVKKKMQQERYELERERILNKEKEIKERGD